MLLTFIKLSFVIKIFVLSIFNWLLKTGFTVLYVYMFQVYCYILECLVKEGPNAFFVFCFVTLLILHMIVLFIILH